MNLARILETALPEVPPQRIPNRYPRIHPHVITREHQEREGTFYRLIIPNGPPHYYRFNQLQYNLVLLFDGKRTYEQVTELFVRRTGYQVTVDEVREFADGLEKSDFWYKTPYEESISLCDALAEQRHKAVKKKKAHVDVTTIELWYFNPEKFLDWLHEKVKFFYTPWWFVWNVFMLVVMGVILGSHWHQFWLDNLYWYDLSGRGILHFFEFLGVFMVIGFFHETAHGLTCHHFGGKSHRMGIFTVYLAPCVFCDCAEAFVVAGRWGRIATIAAGLWAEIQIVAYMSVVWWLTPPASTLHNIAYLLILSGGLFPVFINWNPLSRMDGYFLFCEIFRFFDLKGQSTAYLVGVVRKYIFRMPATVPPMPPLRRVGFITYALLSGAYCYFVLLFFARLAYHVMQYYNPVWAFVPAGMLALLIFKSRLRKLSVFLKELYLDKRDLMRVHWKQITWAGAIALILLMIPVRHEYAEERFILEPVQHTVVRTDVPGRITGVLADEGQAVQAGSTLAQLRDLGLASRQAESVANYDAAASRSREAQLRYSGFGVAEQQRLEMAVAKRVLSQQVQALDVTTPISGVVITPRVHDLVGTYAPAGTVIAEVADLSVMRARVYVSEPEYRKLKTVTDNSLRVDALWTPLEGKVISVSPTSQEPRSGLMPQEHYQGLRPPSFFAVDILLDNRDGKLRDGMTGTAKIFGRRRGLLPSMAQPVVDAIARRLW
ncbi:MAG: efflux RND transporter periplasmic adaptor subunit [Terriglobales bacterium]